MTPKARWAERREAVRLARRGVTVGLLERRLTDAQWFVLFRLKLSGILFRAPSGYVWLGGVRHKPNRRTIAALRRLGLVTERRQPGKSRYRGDARVVITAVGRLVVHRGLSR